MVCYSIDCLDSTLVLLGHLILGYMAARSCDALAGMVARSRLLVGPFGLGRNDSIWCRRANVVCHVVHEVGRACSYPGWWLWRPGVVKKLAAYEAMPNPAVNRTCRKKRAAGRLP